MIGTAGGRVLLYDVRVNLPISEYRHGKAAFIEDI